MHWIQKHIMQRLSTHTSCRYRELKPNNVEGNLFMYHMGQLRKSGFIQKEAGAYALSASGKLFSSRMSLRQGVTLLQPKVVVMLICQNAAGDYLLFRWSRQPYRGLVSFPFSKVHFGHTITKTLEEALFYKTSLNGDFAYSGDAYIRVTDKSEETHDHILAHIYKVTNIKGALAGYDGLTGQPFWGQPKDIPLNEQVPGFMDVVEIVDSDVQGFMQEVVATVDR